MEKKLQNIILNFIKINYGQEEKENPCYNIKKLSKYIKKELEKEQQHE